MNNKYAIGVLILFSLLFTMDFALAEVTTTSNVTVAASYAIPVIRSISVLPATAYNDTILYCQINATSSNNTKLNISYEWYKNGTNVTTLVGNFSDYNSSSYYNISTLTANNTEVGDNWSCSVQAYDAYNYSLWNMSANVTILATPVTPPSGGGGGGGAEYCGNDVCGTGENCTTCLHDCGICPLPIAPPADLITILTDIFHGNFGNVTESIIGGGTTEPSMIPIIILLIIAFLALIAGTKRRKKKTIYKK